MMMLMIKTALTMMLMMKTSFIYIWQFSDDYQKVSVDGEWLCLKELQELGENHHHRHDQHCHYCHHHHHCHGLSAYSHQVGICHYDEGWENDTVTLAPCINLR